ncbi:MAG: ATP-binding cassette domain-containing protein [Deltaproteobacteria bacterium]|nr:ATP-binding cassette domain-containing protein [Deltaproteobacteria bacterium]
MLEVTNVSKSFGGVKAINGVSIRFEPGELSSIIGPNGAGKTTFFNLVTGKLVPDTGKIFFEGMDITGEKPHTIVRKGIGRAFQRTNIFPRLDVYNNVRVAVHATMEHQYRFFSDYRRDGEVNARTEELLASVGLMEEAAETAGNLSHGDQKLLDMAIALALEPRILLLDEPTAGMSPEEGRRTVDLIKKLWEGLGITLIFIEHDMDIVFSISQKIRVLHYGEIIAEGTPDEISGDEKVITAYLGKEV